MTTAAERVDLRLLVLTAFVGSMWVVEAVDSLLDERLQRQGILPRTLDGLDGIVWAPFLHGTFGHLLANTLPLLVLGGLVMVRGLKTWVGVSAFVAAVGGGLTWAFGRTAIHVGASAIVFGYLGFLVVVGFVERRPGAMALGVLVAFLYGGLLWGVVPSGGGVSWEGHLFGFLAGVAAARVFARDPVAPIV